MGQQTYCTRQKLIRKARANTHDLSVTAVLTYPTPDLVGDIVHPDGLNFAEHQKSPWVDLEHNAQPVGWARKSLKQAGGEYGVRFLNLDGHRLPVGTTWFDPNDALQAQVFALVAEDALPGVSLEFRPVPKCFKSLGPSPIEKRPACEFFKVDVVRWTHCARPVNEGATVAKALPVVADKLASILSAGRIGSEQLHPTIAKSLAQFKPTQTLFRVEKAMDDEETTYDADNPDIANPGAATEATTEATPAEPEDDGGSPTAMAAYNLAQGIKDLCEQARAELTKGEHVKGRKAVNKIIDGIETYVEDALAAGKMVDADLSDDSGNEEDKPAPKVTEEDTETDDDGVMKCFSPTVRKALKRFTLQQIQKAQEQEDKELAAANAEVAKALTRLERSRRTLGLRT